MGIEEIIALLELGAKAVSIGVNAYNGFEATMNETDAQRIRDALAKAQAATVDIRAQVDAALDAASKA